MSGDKKEDCADVMLTSDQIIDSWPTWKKAAVASVFGFVLASGVAVADNSSVQQTQVSSSQVKE